MTAGPKSLLVVAAATGEPLLVVTLLGCVVLLNRADDNSATLAPNLVFNR